MSWSLDARIPVLFPPDGLPSRTSNGAPASVAQATVALAPPSPLPDWAVAGVSFEAGVSTHVAGCACCAGRPEAALALDRLFQARARGACAWFDRVVVAPDAAEEVRAALAMDALTAARFRLG